MQTEFEQALEVKLKLTLNYGVEENSKLEEESSQMLQTFVDEVQEMLEQMSFSHPLFRMTVKAERA